VNGATVNITLQNGDNFSYPDVSNWDAFTGFVSTSAIQSMTIKAPLFATMDHFYVGVPASSTGSEAVPEPTTVVVWSLLGIVGVALGRRRWLPGPNPSA
jgi:hypothetical protein